MGVMINLPFGRGRLFSAVQGKPLPPWAAEFDCRTWAQFFLKYIVGHEAVSALGDHHRVDDDQRQVEPVDGGNDSFDDGGVSEHAGLGGMDRDVRGDGFDLGRDDVGWE